MQSYSIVDFDRCAFGLQIHPDEVEDDSNLLLIWDFKIKETYLSVTSSQSGVRPKAPNTNTPDKMPSMPLLNLSSVDCNCSNFPRKGNVLVVSEDEGATKGIENLSLCEDRLPVESSEEDQKESDEEEDMENDEEFDFDEDVVVNSDEAKEYLPSESGPSAKDVSLFSETFTLKGRSFHEHFQDGLKLCKAALMRKETVSLKLVYEPINRRDENAILVHARCDSWRPIGYIPGIKVPKVTVAIEANEITKIALTNIKYQYVFPISSFKYFATVSISKKGKWIKNKDSYKYNEDI